MRSLAIALVLPLALVSALVGAQEPPPAPPEEVEETEHQETPPADEASPAEAADVEEGAQESEEGAPERVLTPEEEEIRRKAAEKAAKREARREKRAAKEEAARAKRSEKLAREAQKRDERADELIALGHASIEAGKYKDALGQFDRARELEGGTSYDAEMGVAHLALARESYAEAVQFAQRAVAATLDKRRKAEALTFAGNASLAARPLIEGDPERPQPGTEIFLDTALRFFIRAVEVAPFEEGEALARLRERFPAGELDPRADRLLGQYLEAVENGEAKHGRRVAAAYEALMTGTSSVDRPVAVVAPISAPRRTSGARPQLPAKGGAPAKRRLAVAFVVRPDGSVAKVEWLDPVPPAVQAQVRQTLMSWTFEPARLPDGTPVAAYWLQGVNVEAE